MQLREPLLLLVESKKDLAYVVKSNALKRKCDESKKKNLEIYSLEHSDYNKNYETGGSILTKML